MHSTQASDILPSVVQASPRETAPTKMTCSLGLCELLATDLFSAILATFTHQHLQQPHVNSIAACHGTASQLRAPAPPPTLSCRFS